MLTTGKPSGTKYTWIFDKEFVDQCKQRVHDLYEKSNAEHKARIDKAIMDTYGSRAAYDEMQDCVCVKVSAGSRPRMTDNWLTLMSFGANRNQRSFRPSARICVMLFTTAKSMTTRVLSGRLRRTSDGDSVGESMYRKQYRSSRSQWRPSLHRSHCRSPKSSQLLLFNVIWVMTAQTLRLEALMAPGPVLAASKKSANRKLSMPFRGPTYWRELPQLDARFTEHIRRLQRSLAQPLSFTHHELTSASILYP